MGLVVGIDLGTTFSAVARMNELGKPEQNNASAAHTAACRATNNRGSDDIAWYLRARASSLMGKAQEAEFEFAEAIRLVPDQPEYHFDLGEVYLQQEKWPEAMREFETVLTYEPNNPQYRTAVAQVYCGLEQPDQALTIMEQVVAENPDDLSYRYYLAIALHDSAIGAMSLFPDGFTPTSERQVELAEQHARRIEELSLPAAEDQELGGSLRDLVATARRHRWIGSDHLKFYVLSVLALVLVPLFTGQGGVIVVGFVGAALVIWMFVARHRKPNWKLVQQYHPDMIRPGI